MRLTRKVLSNVAKPVNFKWPHQNKMLADSLRRLMSEQQAIGLAAPQVGISKRVFVMEINGRFRTCFNPEILKSSDVSSDFDEGCLSFPGESCKITRPDWVEVRYQQADGASVIDTLVELEARCFQHELDHLNGITMHDRLKEQHAKQS
jgi:peptide deformylase